MDNAEPEGTHPKKKKAITSPFKRAKQALSLSAMGKMSKDAIKRSQSIDNQLQRELEQKKRELTLLLLGGAYCGKSTFVKQLRIHYGDGFPEEERLQHRNQVLENISGAAFKVVDHMRDTSGAFEDNELEEKSTDFQRRNPILDINEVLKRSPTQEDAGSGDKSANSFLAMACTELTKRFAYMSMKCGGLTDQDAEILRSMWQDEGFRRGYTSLQARKGRHHGALTPHELYFCSDIDRIMAPDYIPTHQDILYIRRPTLGVIEHLFSVDDFVYRVIDVAGQKSQRKKWIHLFENVTVVMFFVSLSAFDENLEEDESLNSLDDSLQTFHEVSHNHYLDKTDFLLFLNKFDLFTEKLASVQFNSFMKSYNGENTPDACVKYIRELFHQHRPCHKQVFTHVMCATDVTMMSDLLSQVINIVAEINLRKSGVLF